MNKRYPSIEINLLPDHAIPVARFLRPFIIGGVIFGLILLALFVTTMIANTNRASLDKELAQVNGQISELQSQISKTNALGSVREYVNLSNAIRTSFPNATLMMQEFQNMLVDGMHVQSLQIENGNQFTFSASFATTDILTQFSQKIVNSKTFSMVSSSGFNNVSVGPNVVPLTQVAYVLSYQQQNAREEDE